MRYILATRILSDLLHLVASLAAKCEGEPCEGEVTDKAAKGSRPPPPCSGSSRAVVDHRLVLRLIESAAGFMSAVVLFPSCPGSGAREVPRHRTELSGSLIQSMTRTLERLGSTERGEYAMPEDDDRTGPGVIAEDSGLVAMNREKCAKGCTSDVDTGGAMAPISGGSIGRVPLTRRQRSSHGLGEQGGFVSCTGGVSGSPMTTAPARSSPAFCRSLAELSDGSLAAQPARARMVMDAPEVPDVMATLVSLLASMTAFDARRWGAGVGQGGWASKGIVACGPWDLETWMSEGR